MVVACLLGFAATADAHSSGGSQSPMADATVGCSALERIDFLRVPDAPIEIIAATSVDSVGDNPGYCQVNGYIAPRTGFVLRLPYVRWNGKFIELGCGGFCGSTNHIADCDESLRRGYACAVTDGGHLSTGGQVIWADHNLQAVIDYLVGASHLTAIAGKAIVTRYYSHPPKRSYFMGCSAGGEQAVMEAQRFPWDFDGIIAGQPTSEVSENVSYLWNILTFKDRLGKPVLNAADLQLLHQKVLEACDLDDGVADKIVGNPQNCRFNPSTLRCSREKAPSCLSEEKVEAVERIYGGPVNSQGEQISMAGAVRGSELNWSSSFVGTTSDPVSPHDFAAAPFRYFMFQPNPGTMWNPEDFDFNEDYKRLGVADGLISASNPDLPPSAEPLKASAASPLRASAPAAS